MGTTVLAAYDKLIPGTFKTDLFRHSVLYIHGGCYFDSGLIYVEHIRDSIRPDDMFVSSPDGGANPRNSMNSAFICCVPKHGISDITIRRTVRRIANE